MQILEYAIVAYPLDKLGIWNGAFFRPTTSGMLSFATKEEAEIEMARLMTKPNNSIDNDKNINPTPHLAIAQVTVTII